MSASSQYPAREDITAAIIAGGRGSRVDGKDKGLLMLHGLPMVSRIIHRISPQVGEVMVNANRNHDTYRQFGVEVFPDSTEGYQGPLAGILTALEKVKTPYLLVVPCDTPSIPHDLVKRMAMALSEKKKQVAVVDDGRQQQYMFLLLASPIHADLKDFFDSGGRAVKHWLATQDVAWVDFSDCAWAFENINRIDDLRHLEGGE